MGQTVIETTISGAEAVAKATQSAPFRPTRLFSSDLPRCADLARGLADAFSVPVHFDPRLREMNFGEWEGRHYDAIEAEDGERWHTWCNNWMTEAPPVESHSMTSWLACVNGSQTKSRHPMRPS